MYHKFTTCYFFHCIFADLLGERGDDEDGGDIDEVYVMQASVHSSEQSRQASMILCKNLHLVEAYQAWTRALGYVPTGKDVFQDSRDQ